MYTFIHDRRARPHPRKQADPHDVRLRLPHAGEWPRPGVQRHRRDLRRENHEVAAPLGPSPKNDVEFLPTEHGCGGCGLRGVAVFWECGLHVPDRVLRADAEGVYAVRRGGDALRDRGRLAFPESLVVGLGHVFGDRSSFPGRGQFQPVGVPHHVLCGDCRGYEVSTHATTPVQFEVRGLRGLVPDGSYLCALDVGAGVFLGGASCHGQGGLPAN
mmetsp:Transcript_23173/g.60297  ORF Transcript_23173/g.60297 Transcript_23173/m.60297 type:complete len:215 (+) Transcript_23173:255-899(+)